jgi:hypothetical protein
MFSVHSFDILISAAASCGYALGRDFSALVSLTFAQLVSLFVAAWSALFFEKLLENALRHRQSWYNFGILENASSRLNAKSPS